MTTLDELVADVIAAADGKIIGRIRLQKIFYLLEQAGLGSKLTFHYHHYGPYSRDLDDALGDAQVFQDVREEIKHRQVDGMPYSVFSFSPDSSFQDRKKLGRIGRDKARSLIRLMKRPSSTVLELAATVHWLAKKEKIADWRSEILRRKGTKTAEGRLDEAIALLDSLGMSIA
jgi:uncharacterized protein YwgA